MKTAGQILDQVVEALGTNYNELAKAIGLDRPDKFYNIRSGKNNPNYETLQAIVKAYPQVNCRFLLMGEGEPLEKEPEPLPPIDEFQENRNAYLIGHLDEEIKQLRQRIEVLEKAAKH